MPGKGRPPQAIPSPISRHIITCYVRYQGSKHTVIYIYIYIYIYILVQTVISVQAKLEVIRRKHIVYLTGFGAYSSTWCKRTDKCTGTMGVDQLPSSTVRLYTLDNASNDKRPSRHIAALTFHELVQKFIGSRWIIGIRDITFSNIIIVTVKCFPTTIDWGCVMTCPVSNINSCTVEVLKWIRAFIPRFTVHIVTYPCWD